MTITAQLHTNAEGSTDRTLGETCDPLARRAVEAGISTNTADAETINASAAPSCSAGIGVPHHSSASPDSSGPAIAPAPKNTFVKLTVDARRSGAISDESTFTDRLMPP